MHSAPAKAISYVAGMGFWFCGNKSWSFASRRWSWTEPLLYGSLYLASLGINVTVNALVLHAAGIRGYSGSGSAVAGFLVATGVTATVNFIGNRHLVFRSGRPGRSRIPRPTCT